VKKFTILLSSLALLGMVAATVSVDTTYASSGKSLYTSKGCKGCHTSGGKAPKPQHQASLSEKDFFNCVRNRGKNGMPKWTTKQVTDAQVKKIRAYLQKHYK